MSPEFLRDDDNWNIVYAKLPEGIPGNLVCFVDKDYNQLTTWAKIDDLFHAKWENGSNEDGTVIGFLLRDPKSSVILFQKLDVPIIVHPESIPMDLAIFLPEHVRSRNG